uniref:Uncharacterized protein n=1 Tax=Salvator merianae TaxID=96440 RepID=A0A8D0BWB6_SALMN
MDKVDKEKFFSLSHHTRTRGRSLKLMGRRVRTDKGKYFFTQRVVGLWNLLPDEVVTAISLDKQNSQALFYYSLPFSVPWQVQYFVPLTDAEFRERLARHKGEITIMLRSSDFNQDKTALIETNNPFPLLISGQHLSVPLQYFPKDVLGRVGWASFLSMLKMKNLGYQGSEKSQIETSEGSQKRLQKLYPHLHTKKIEPLPSIQGWSATASQWEPLTISCLTETKPTVLVPGEDGFRYGSAPLWIVNNSMVTKHSK